MSVSNLIYCHKYIFFSLSKCDKLLWEYELIVTSVWFQLLGMMLFQDT